MDIQKATNDLAMKHAAEVRDLVRNYITNVLGGVPSAISDDAEAPPRRSRRARTVRDAMTAPTRAKRGAKRVLGQKRDPKEIEKITARVDGYIEKHAGDEGVGVEAMGKALGLATREMALPIKKLLASKQVKAKGVKRATKYFPGTAAARAKNGAAEASA